MDRFSCFLGAVCGNSRVVEILTGKVYTIVEIDYGEMEEQMLAPRTDKQKDSQDAYMEKLQDIKVRVPKEYYDKIKSCAESD